MGWYTYCPHCNREAKYAAHDCGCISKENERIIKLLNQCKVIRMFHYEVGVPYVAIYWHIQKEDYDYFIYYAPPQNETLSCYREITQKEFNEAWETTEETISQYNQQNDEGILLAT